LLGNLSPSERRGFWWNLALIYSYNIDYKCKKWYNGGYLMDKASIKCTFKIRGYEIKRKL